MKTIISILLCLFITNLFAQEKHSELYYKVDSIYKTNVKKVPTDTFSFKTRIKLQNGINSDIKKALLVIDGVPCDYSVLDTIDINNIVSIDFMTPSTFGNGRDGCIIIKLKEPLKKIKNGKS